MTTPAVPPGLDLLLAPVPHRPGWAALVLTNDFKMRPHLVRYTRTTTNPPTGRHHIANPAALADPALRRAAEQLVDLWNAYPERHHTQHRPAFSGGDDYAAWARVLNDYNTAALNVVVGDVSEAVSALEQLTAGTVRFSDGDGHALELALSAGPALLTVLDRWLTPAPTPRTVVIDTDHDQRTAEARIFAESVGDLLVWARHTAQAEPAPTAAPNH
jgi:hypothetical protein